MKAVDLFAGCGGMSLGFQNAGFDIVAAFEFWDIAYVLTGYFLLRHKNTRTRQGVNLYLRTLGYRCISAPIRRHLNPSRVIRSHSY